MFRYPLTLTFPAFSLTPVITVKDSQGAVLFTASKKLISSKEEVHVSTNGKPAYTVISQENRITEIPSNWDIKTADGRTLAVVNDDFLSAVDSSKFIPNNMVAGFADMGISRAFNLRAVKMYWINDTNGRHIGLVAPDQKSLVAMELPLISDFVRKLPSIFFRLITPSYYVRFGEETVMFMQKKRTLLLDTYTLDVRGKFSDTEEAFLLNSVILTLVYERQRLKDLYS